MLLLLFISALLVGFALGLMGAGGSIIAVPLLMLLQDMSEKVAIKHALIIVGLIAIIGALIELRNQRLNQTVLFVFSTVSLPAASLGAYCGYILPAGWQTVILSTMMLLAAYKVGFVKTETRLENVNLLTLSFAALVAGFITGLVGIGGGFLIVPALILFAGLNMAPAVFHSLLLIFVNALVAFLTLELTPGSPATDWMVVGVMTFAGVCAVWGGNNLTRRMSDFWLKKGFAFSLVLVASSLLINQY